MKKKKKTAERRHLFFFWWEKFLKRKRGTQKKSPLKKQVEKKARWNKSTFIKTIEKHSSKKRHLPKKKKRTDWERKPFDTKETVEQQKPIEKKNNIERRKPFDKLEKKHFWFFLENNRFWREKPVEKKKKPDWGTNKAIEIKWLLKNENFFGKTRWQKINLLKNIFWEKCWKTAGKQNLSR